MLRNTWNTLSSHPIHFFLLQIPLGVIPLLDEALPQDSSQTLFKVVMALLVFFPLFVGCSVVAIAATFQSVLRSIDHLPLSFFLSYKATFSRFSKLFPASLIAMGLALLGFPTIVLLIYFSAIYLFVPHFVMLDGSCSWSVYLARSKNLVKTRFWVVILVAIFLLLLEPLLMIGGHYLGGLLPGLSSFAPLQDCLQYLLKGFLSMVAGLMVNVALSHFFLHLRTGQSHEINSQ